MATQRVPLIGRKGKIDVDLLEPPAERQPWVSTPGNIITLGGTEVVDPRDPEGKRKIPNPFDIKIDAAGLAAAQKALVEAAQAVLGKMSDGGRPAYVFGGEGAQHGGKLLPQLLIDAGNAGFDVMQPSANHIDLARCAVDAAYCAWIKAVHTAAKIPLLSVSVHMDAYFLMAAIHDPRAREILGEDPELTDEQLRTVLLHKMALILIGAARLGIQALHLFWGQPGSVPPYGWPFHPAGGTNVKAMRALFVQIMKPLVQLAEQLGIFLCDEIHFGTIAMNADDYIAIWEELGRPKCLVLGFDPSHFWHGETWWQALDKLRKAGIKVVLCHFKQTVLLGGRPMLGYEVDDRRRGMFFVQLSSSSGIVDMNVYAGQLTIPGTGLVEFWHGTCNLPIPGYAEAEDPHWATWPVLVSGVRYLQGLPAPCACRPSTSRPRCRPKAAINRQPKTESPACDRRTRDFLNHRPPRNEYHAMISSLISELTELLNIGKKMEQHLHEIGVFTLNDLQKMGALEAWERIRAKDPQKDCCICALYALEGATVGIRWHELPEKVKEVLRDKAARSQ